MSRTFDTPPATVSRKQIVVGSNVTVWCRRGSCACCNTCWIVDEGPQKGRCLYGGPFSGYSGIS